MLAGRIDPSSEHLSRLTALCSHPYRVCYIGYFLCVKFGSVDERNVVMSESNSIGNTAANAGITAVQSGSAAVRLRETRGFLDRFEPGAEGFSSEDHAVRWTISRALSLERGAIFGLHRLSCTQLAPRITRQCGDQVRILSNLSGE